jgi:hypothetical protein
MMVAVGSALMTAVGAVNMFVIVSITVVIRRAVIRIGSAD